MIKLRVRVFLLRWSYYWVALVDAAIGIFTLGIVDFDFASRFIVIPWHEATWLLAASKESWDDPDDWPYPDDLSDIGYEWLLGETEIEPPSNSDHSGSIDITIFE